MKSLSIFSFIFALLSVIMGATVRITGSGLGCPDWPLCHGRLIPPADFYAWIEWLHRFTVLFSTVFVSILCIKGFLFNRKLVFLLPVTLIVVQIFLGALTVITEIHPIIAVLHTVVAVLYLGIIAHLGSGFVFAKKSPLDSEENLMLRLSLAGILFSVITGSVVARSGSSYASDEIPLVTLFAFGSDLVYFQLIQAIHRIIAYLTFILLLVLSYKLIRKSDLKLFGILISFVATFQICLGLLNIYTGFTDLVRVGHIIVAFIIASTLSSLFTITEQ
ncbi:MAG: COX15/CtaA family protein [Planctomycetes bacterium]|nr:COX15/CtaA family protein [Planctomycetota bacterium]